MMISVLNMECESQNSERIMNEGRVLWYFEVGYRETLYPRRGSVSRIWSSWSKSSGASSSSSSSSPSAPPPRRNLTLLPSIHSIPRTPSCKSTIRTPGTLTPALHRTFKKSFHDIMMRSVSYLRHLSNTRASPAILALVRDTSRLGCRYCLWNRYLRSTGVASTSGDWAKPFTPSGG